jgi:hypothetical protein
MEQTLATDLAGAFVVGIGSEVAPSRERRARWHVRLADHREVDLYFANAATAFGAGVAYEHAGELRPFDLARALGAEIRRAELRDGRPYFALALRGRGSTIVSVGLPKDPQAPGYVLARRHGADR